MKHSGLTELPKAHFPQIPFPCDLHFMGTSLVSRKPCNSRKIVFFSEKDEDDPQSHDARDLGRCMTFRNKELNIIGTTDLKNKAIIRD